MPARPRLTLRLAAVGVLLTAPALASCGFDEATNQVNQITAGQTVHDGVVDLSNVLLVSEDEGSGTLVGLMHNSSSEQTITLESVEGDGVTVSEAGIELAPQQRGLLEDGGLRVDGDFAPGRVLPMTFAFDNGEEVDVNVQVKRACGQYTGYDDAPSGDEPGGVQTGGAEPGDLDLDTDSDADVGTDAEEPVEPVDCGVEEPESHDEEAE